MRARERLSDRVVLFKKQAAIELAREAGCTNGLQMAAFYNVSIANWSKVANKTVKPGEAFIAAVLGSHPDDPRFVFETFFEVVRDADAS